MATRDQAEQSYYPSVRVRLILRFEDWNATDAPAPPAKPPQLRAGKKDEAPLKVEPSGAGGFVLTSKASKPQVPGGPQGQTTAPDGRTFEIAGIVPLTCEVMRKGIRSADECTITLPLADFPFDPRAIRSCAVQVYMGTVTPTEFERGVLGETRGDASPAAAFGGDPDPTPLSAVADTYVDPYDNQRSNLRFSGWVDLDTVELSEEDAPTVSFECVDNTKLLADQNAPPKLAISADLPFDRAVAEYLANFPQCEGLEVEMRPPGADRPTLKAALSKSAFKPDLGPPPDGKSTVLDYLADSAMALGLMLWLEGVSVVIQRPRTLYATGAVRPSDPFSGRVLPSGRVLQRRTLVWGVNLTSASFSRHLGRKAGQNVECRSYSGKLKRTLVVRHPQKGQRPTTALPSGATDDKWHVTEVNGVEDEATLRAVAQAVYEASGREELRVRVGTKNLGSLGGSNDDPDLLDVEVGDAIDVEASRGDFSDEERDDGFVADVASGAGSSGAAAYIRRIGYSDELARAYERCISAAAFPTTFRVKTWTLSWDREAGISVGGELINYVEVRADRELPEGEEAPIEAAAGTPVRVSVD